MIAGMVTQQRSHAHPTTTAIREDDPSDGWGMTVIPGPPVGLELSVASAEEVMDALRGLDIDGPWEVIAPSVVPVLPRRRPMPGDADPPIVRQWPGGLTSTFGIDVGPALVFISEGLLARWSIDADVLAAQAITNLHERLPRALADGVLHDATGGLPLTAFQSGDGWASTLLLAPDLLPAVFGPEPALLLAPMRDLLIALPVDADPGLAAWMLDDFAALDPNGLDVPVMAFLEGAVRPLDRVARTAIRNLPRSRMPRRGPAGPMH